MINIANAKAVSVLKHLIRTCQDGHEGFSSARDGVKTEELKQLFASYAKQCKQLLSELRPEVRDLGGNPDLSSSSWDSRFRGWMNLRQALNSTNEAAVVEEVERSEDIALQNYLKALKENLPAKARVVVVRQYDQIKKSYERISALKQAQIQLATGSQ